MRKILFILGFLSVTVCSAQYLNRANISVTENGNSIPNPWSGGLNACQFSEIDLNQDGTNDLFVFDRVGDRILPFLNGGASGSIDFTYAPQYISSFPPLQDWALLVDYNCDDKADIFTYNGGYVSVYKNTSTTGNLQFDLEEDILLTDYSSLISSILISYVDIPAILDVDNDGDIDILTFQQTGGHIEFHKNLSMEQNGNCNELVFEMETNCWGDFYEGLNVYDFNACSEEAGLAPSQQHSSAHSGSSSLALDMDADGDKEIVLGDVSYNNLNLIHNGGTLTEADMVSADQDFPIGSGSTVTGAINSFPAAFYVDVNNDAVRDLLVSPNIRNNSENLESVKLFINNGADNEPDFNHYQNNFLQDNTIDFGSGAYPALLDYNNDGLQDLLVGNYGYYNSGNHIAKLALFKNTGTTTNPTFQIVDRDFGGLSSIPLNTILNMPVAGLTPTLADLDDDGDTDLVVGDADGKVHYFKNTASAGSDAQFALETVNLGSIDVGQFAAPFLIDINGDDLYDLVIGQHNGTLSYFENTGDANTPIFDTEVEDFGGVSVANDEGTYGFSKPFFHTENGETQLLVGTQSGRIYHYNNISLTGTFTLITDFFKNVRDGEKVGLAYADFTNDGKNDLFLGNESGGLFYFQNDTVSEGTGLTDLAGIKANIYPNPTTGNLYIYLEGETQLEVFNLMGQSVHTTTVSGSTTLSLGGLPKGIYLVQLQQKDKPIYWQKIILQ
jgi:hypothetical protein